MKAKTVMLFANGNAAVFDADGQQMPMLQESWLLLFVAFLEREGVTHLEDTDFVLPNTTHATLFKRPGGGWNWEIK